MIRRPPRSTLFPYTTLSDLTRKTNQTREPSETRKPTEPNGCKRSEEHTSELQSHLNLVCRLLLEKKKPTPPPCVPALGSRYSAWTYGLLHLNRSLSQHDCTP